MDDSGSGALSTRTIWFLGLSVECQALPLSLFPSTVGGFISSLVSLVRGDQLRCSDSLLLVDVSWAGGEESGYRIAKFILIVVVVVVPMIGGRACGNGRSVA
jgi:hypothetical protein